MGVALDIIAWILTLIAVRTLPLFLVQAVIAGAVVITALIDRFILHRKRHIYAYWAILVVLVGLVALAVAAVPGHARQTTVAVHWSILLAPLILLLLGTYYVRTHTKRGAGILAGLSGIAFGGTSIVGRVLYIPHPYWHMLTNPLLYALALYGGFGILLFTISLQRTSATTTNAAMIAAQTVSPALFGVLFLGDSVRHGWWPAMVVGILLTLIGTLVIALTETPVTSGTKAQSHSQV
jgi:drug/metabolite transporter (DMT)-like permease